MKPSARLPLVAGNWKLYNTLAQARALCASLRERLGPAQVGRAEVAVAPVFTALTTVKEALTGSSIELAAQDTYWESQGAFTGEVGATLLKDVGCSYVICGHSERRTLFAEKDDDVRKKARAILDAGMAPIICVGESLETRERGQTEPHVLAQVEAALHGLDTAAAAKVVIAYEPIWAIGTGRTAQPADAQRVQAAIRALCARRFSPALADGMRILYGGSVKSDNARALMAEPDVDGALVGGASLDAASFAAIVAAAGAQKSS